MGIGRTLWNKACDYLLIKEDKSRYRIDDEMLLDEARKELKQAYNIFTMTEDPELIDFAIYNLKAAEKRYDYLIKRLKG